MAFPPTAKAGGLPRLKVVIVTVAGREVDRAIETPTIHPGGAETVDASCEMGSGQAPLRSAPAQAPDVRVAQDSHRPASWAYPPGRAVAPRRRDGIQGSRSSGCWRRSEH